jgi:DNA-binding MarR family transcriptional regulator
LNDIVEKLSSQPILDQQTDQQTMDFVEHVDAIAERLTPQRRPQDADDPECSPMELRALAVLGRREPVTMSELAAALRVPLSSVTHTVDKLVSKRLVERRRVKTDRRLVQVGFSKRGKEINRFVTGKRLAEARCMLEALKPAERAVVVKRLEKMASKD